MSDGSNFQHAPPGMRRSGNGPQATLPEGVAEPGRRRSKKAAPEAAVPEQYVGPAGPEGGIGMVCVFMLAVGVMVLVQVPTGGQLALAVGFMLAGAVGCYAWVQAWLEYRRAWKFEWRLLPRKGPGRLLPKGWWRK